MHCGLSTVVSCLFIWQCPILRFSPTVTNINREPLCSQAPTHRHNWSKFLEQTQFSLTAVPRHLQLRTAGSLCLPCAISESRVQPGFKGKILIVNCTHRKASSAPWSGSHAEINQKIILKYNFMAVTEFEIWNVYPETFRASTDALKLKINALPGKLSLRGASLNKEGHTHSAALFIAQDDSRKRINAVT